MQLQQQTNRLHHWYMSSDAFAGLYTPMSLLAFCRAIDHHTALAAPPDSTRLATFPALMTVLLCGVSMRPLQTATPCNANSESLEQKSST